MLQNQNYATDNLNYGPKNQDYAPKIQDFSPKNQNYAPKNQDYALRIIFPAIELPNCQLSTRMNDSVLDLFAMKKMMSWMQKKMYVNFNKNWYTKLKYMYAYISNF